jgi:hypothetical protein
MWMWVQPLSHQPHISSFLFVEISEYTLYYISLFENEELRKLHRNLQFYKK